MSGDHVAAILLWTLVVLSVGQAALTVVFVRALGRFRRPRLADAACPSAAIVLCVRGTDPFLTDVVSALLNQDYPEYRVIVVVDRVDDPAWRVVETAIAQSGTTHATMQALTARQDTCSLKCSSLVQALSSLDPSIEIAAQLDADTVPHPTWLRELAAALADDRVGAATGNRWYMPVHPTLGSLVRYLWNAAAVVQMYVFDIAWGGTLAIKTRVLRETGLLDRWSRAFCEDTMLFARLREHGYRVRFVPSLMMVNREVCDVPGFYYWVRRQMVTARLYHPSWFQVSFFGLMGTITPFAAAASWLLALIRHDTAAAWWSGVGVVLYQLTLLPMVFSMEGAVRQIASSRREPTRWLSAATVAKLLPALVVSQIVTLTAIVSAIRLRIVEWRGVSYRVDGPWEIRLTNDQPLAAPPVTATKATLH